MMYDNKILIGARPTPIKMYVSNMVLVSQITIW